MFKKHWFQFHLSTLLILSFVAGVLIWANLREFHVESGGYEMTNCGFPFPIKEIHFRDIDVDCMFDVNEAIRNGAEFVPAHVALNIAFGIVVLAAAAGLFEWLIRRKRKLSHPT
jgi:hypothetical protein